METSPLLWGCLTNHRVLLLFPFVVSTVYFFLSNYPRKTYRAALFKVLPVWSLCAFVVLDQSDALNRGWSLRVSDLVPEGRYPLMILLALLASSVGDVGLILSDATVVIGGIAFLIAHRFYFVSIDTSGDPDGKILGLFLVTGVCLLVYIQTGSKARTGSKPVLTIFWRVGLTIYLTILFAVGWKFAAKFQESPNDISAILGFYGSILFIISDVLIFVNYVKVEIPSGKFWYMLTYYLAQLAYAVSTVEFKGESKS